MGWYFCRWCEGLRWPAGECESVRRCRDESRNDSGMQLVLELQERWSRGEGTSSSLTYREGEEDGGEGR